MTVVIVIIIINIILIVKVILVTTIISVIYYYIITAMTGVTGGKVNFLSETQARYCMCGHGYLSEINDEQLSCNYNKITLKYTFGNDRCCH